MPNIAWAPPFSDVVTSCRGCSTNVGSRVILAGFASARRALTSTFPSAGSGGPAALLGGPWISLCIFGPLGEVDRRIEATVAVECPHGQVKTRSPSRLSVGREAGGRVRARWCDRHAEGPPRRIRVTE